MTLRLINFGRESTISEYFTKNEFKEIILKNFRDLELLNQSTIPDFKKIGLSHFYMAISGVNDKFVVIENLKISDEDIDYLFDLNKQYLLVATPFYNKETGELFDLDDIYHQPKLVKTYNEARPAFLFYDINNNNDNLADMYCELELLLTHDISDINDFRVKQVIDSLFKQFPNNKCLLVHNNRFYGNFTKTVIQYEYHQELTFYI